MFRIALVIFALSSLPVADLLLSRLAGDTQANGSTTDAGANADPNGSQTDAGAHADPNG